MEELKACLFCGRYIDRTYRYCPYCGYEFVPEDDATEVPEETAGTPAAETAADSPEELARQAVPGTGTYYLLRLKDIQKLLTDMERELDLMISRTVQPRGPVERPPEGALTTSSRDP
jgi:hypothetical protein